MNLTIRKDELNDYHIVENVFREAFWNLYIPGCQEHFIAHCIRQHSDFISELSFVLEVDNTIVGAIMYTHSKVIDSQNNKEYPTITFGPVAILPEFQQRGLGRKLIEYSIIEAKKLGYKAIMIGGYPYHYHSYGFVGSKKYNISMPDGKFYKGVLALPLEEGALDNISGMLYFSEAFEQCGISSEQNKEKFLLFEKQFSLKEKSVTESQAKFEQFSVEIDDNKYL